MTPRPNTPTHAFNIAKVPSDLHINSRQLSAFLFWKLRNAAQHAYPVPRFLHISEIRVMSPSKQQSLRLFFLRNLLVAFGVSTAAILSVLLFQGGGELISPVWPAGGIALAGVIHFGGRVLPGVYIPLAASSLLSGNPWVFSLLAPAGLALSVWVGAGCLRWFRFDPRMKSTRDILLLAGCGVAIPMAMAGYFIALCMHLGGLVSWEQIFSIGLIYWTANAAGSLIAAPVVLLLASGGYKIHRRALSEVILPACQLGLVGGSAWIAFSESGSGLFLSDAIAYLPFPFIVWAALSGGLRLSTLSVLATVCIAAAFTSRGLGPFAAEGGLESFWLTEVFIAIITSTGLLIGAGSDAQRRETRLKAEAATREAELERLKAQVNPHFLFNCLTAIHTLIRTDGSAAERGLVSLSALLRKSLDVAKEPFIPLREELEIIRDALRLQKLRYEEGLEWSVSADVAAERFLVPPMLLQPLVENSVKHGVCDGFGRVDLVAEVVEGQLVVRVSNTAPEGCDPESWQESVGLSSVRARITSTCPAGSRLEFSMRDGGHVEACVTILPTSNRRS